MLPPLRLRTGKTYSQGSQEGGAPPRTPALPPRKQGARLEAGEEVGLEVVFPAPAGRPRGSQTGHRPAPPRRYAVGRKRPRGARRHPARLAQPRPPDEEAPQTVITLRVLA
jgi:hypothetical protein